MDLSIIVINWNTTDLLVQCLQSVQKYGTGIEYNLIVADNASTDADVRLTAERFPEFKWLFSQENKGGLIINEALHHLQGRYVLFLGPDAQIQPGCLQGMVHFLDSFPEAGAVSAMLFNPDLSPQYYFRRLPKPCTLFFCRTAIGAKLDRKFLGQRFVFDYEYKGISLESIVEVEQPPGACLMVRSDLARDKNGQIIDSRFPFYFNDVDLCKRVYSAGYRIFLLPDAKVIHHQSASFSKRDKDWNRREHFAGLLNYLKKYYRNWVLVFYFYYICQTILLLGYIFTRLILSPNNMRLRNNFRREGKFLIHILKIMN